MNFRRHKTEQEKEIRRKMYKMLREAGLNSHEAQVYRDWTSNKIKLICSGSKPARTW